MAPRCPKMARDGPKMTPWYVARPRRNARSVNNYYHHRNYYHCDDDDNEDDDDIADYKSNYTMTTTCSCCMSLASLAGSPC